MRGFLASSIGVTCAAALALPLALPAPAQAGPPAVTSEPAVPGSTQSLPLVPLGADRALGSAAPEQGLTRRGVRPFSLVGVVWDNPASELHGRVQVRTRAVGNHHWSGWQDIETHNREHAADPDTPEGASRRVRGSTAPLWVGSSDGVEVRVQAEEAAESEGAGGAEGEERVTVPGDSPLPRGLHLELVDPGADPPRASVAPAAAPPRAGVDPGAAPPRSGAQVGRAPLHAPVGRAPVHAPVGRAPVHASVGRAPLHAPVGGARAGVSMSAQGAGDPSGAPADNSRADALPSETAVASAANTDLAPLGALEIPALSQQETERAFLAARPGTERVKPYIGARPRIITRRGWGANEKLRERGFIYTKKVKAAFVHHTGSGNNYSCSQSPSVIRSIYRYHVVSSGWRDIGYNFLVDKCGNIYEGRAGGVAKPVMGAHTLGFNSNSMGIAVLGSYNNTKPSSAALKAIARLSAWKLGLYGANPRGKTYLKSGGGNLYRKGKNVRLNVISGHRDGFATECPGRLLYGKLGTARKEAARYQGR
ncbi:N-acetylmuramoyl-L-alanine amidase [Streptomyces sp. NPDC058246]|uniref:peptidoglycan recognition protein family protein n=1 Tax=Streptomyces sp. NPDC058246 TaxID=3346400 RepID=UPI0036E037C9